MKDVILDIEHIKLPRTGLGQVCLNLSQAILKKNKDLDLGFYSPKRAEVGFGIPKGMRYKINPLHRIFPSLLPKSKIWHATHQGAPYIPNHSELVLTVHDINHIHETESADQKKKLLHQLEQKIKRAAHVVFISHFIQREVLHYFDIPEDERSVIHNGVVVGPQQAKPPFPIPQKFFLTLGAVARKKNFHTLIDVMALREEALIIAGSTHTGHLHRERPYAKMIRKQICEKKLEDRVFLVGSVTEAEKSYLIENCRAFLFPSLLEGFGLPPVESMRRGKPTFVSQKTSLPEICGDHAYYFTSFDPHDMADVLKEGLKDFSDAKANAMIAWSEQYTWKKTAKSYLEIYQNILKK